ncbi:SDR family oxidoreductase [Tunicatimonas pelagia]|uniref:SDR family oxidoreductase n=1 Tax=Tunicatimonas pelagia TaxID=931531 RepID=UPI0026650C53|nr:SDR family oxidoreductase [Tunicatimonas pelagia]WKN43648.1 SDR family oxidoreductase [Tunicatimonas pelagia]
MARRTVQGKVAVITGSSMGIGKATAKLLASQGAKVVINGRTENRLEQTRQELEQTGYEVRAVVADISTLEGASRLIAEAINHFGQIDILINNAGMSSRGYFEEIEPEVLERMLQINVMGCLHPTKAALPYLESTSGSIVFVSSVAGIRGLPETGIYCATKMALTAVAESLKVELSDKSIHVGIVYVGITENDPGKRVIDKDGSYLLLKDRKQRNTQTPEEVARAIVRMVKKRQFKKILTVLGKLNALANVLFPRLVDWVLIRSKERIRRLNT